MRVEDRRWRVEGRGSKVEEGGRRVEEGKEGGGRRVEEGEGGGERWRVEDIGRCIMRVGMLVGAGLHTSWCDQPIG